MNVDRVLVAVQRLSAFGAAACFAILIAMAL